MPAEKLPPPAPWTFGLVRRDTSVALPAHCAIRGPLTRAPVAKSTRFVADPRSLGALAIADIAERPPRLTGVAALSLDPEGTSHDPREIPWFHPTAVPRFTHAAGGAIVAGFDRPGAGSTSVVGLFRDGIAEPLGEGDAFEAIDMACVEAPSGPRCALLTSRIGKVAPAGAMVWVGSPKDPAAAWRSVEIVPARPDSDARPFGLGSVEVAARGRGAADAGALDVNVVAILAEKGELVYVEAGEGAPREVARIPGGHGAIDAIALPAPVAMTYATPLDDDGCAADTIDGGGSGIAFSRADLPETVVRVPAPPTFGAIRRLEKGAIAAWLAPLGCNRPRRVVYAVVLDAQGSPVSAPMAVADGTGFAVAASGADVDLFLQDDTSVTWVRMTCAP